MLDCTLLPYIPYVHSVYMNADHHTGPFSGRFQKSIARFLKKCVNISSLGLYFHGFSTNLGQLQQVVLSMVEEGNLSALGFYFHNILTKRNIFRLGDAAWDLIDALVRSERAQGRVKRLDFALAAISSETRDLIRSSFPNLESLTMRRMVCADLENFWDRDRLVWWGTMNSMTRLQFYDCPWLYASHITSLIALFPSLRELLVSACGDCGDHGALAKDWHLSPDALCNNHHPLDWLHIEHMKTREILLSGQVPTKTLIVTSTKLQFLLEAMKRDEHLFPGLKVLRLKATHGRNGSTKQGDSTRAMLEEICARRGVEIFRDARSIHICTCCKPSDM
jgi:hypothetical protein